MTEDEAVTHINRCIDRVSAEGYEDLADTEKIAFLASSTDFEILSGGLMGFYYNSSGDMVTEVANALAKIGAFDASAAIVQSSRLFPEPGRLSQRDYRQEFLPSIYEQLRGFEGIYHQQSPTVWELIINYVITNSTVTSS